MKNKHFYIKNQLFSNEELAPETRPVVIYDIREEHIKTIQKIFNKFSNRFTLPRRKLSHAILLISIFSMNLASGQSEVTDDQLQVNAQTSQKINFPNAIHISREDINGILVGLVGDDPNGIASLLALKAGLTFRNTGDAGAETWFIVRNFGRDNSRMTLILLDGRPLNLGNNHTVEFDDIPVNIIESITIYPGPVPAQYGGFQSVIEIETQRNKDILLAGVNVGTNANYRFTTTVGKAGRFHYLANFDLDMSDGQTDQYLSGILSDFRYTNREVRTFLPTIKMGYEFNNDLDLTLQGNFVDFKKMFSTEPLFGQEASRRRMMQNYSLVLQPGRDSEKDYRFIAYQNRASETLNPLFPEDTTYNVNWGNQKRTFTGFRGYYRHSLLEGKLSLSGGGEGHWAKGRTDDEKFYFQFENKQNFYGAFLQAELSFWQGSYISLGARIDKQNGINKTYFSPVASVSQSVLDNKLGIYASYGNQRRWIPLNEVNSFNRPSTVLGPPFLQGNINMPTPELDMELLRAFDIGFTTKLFESKLTTRVNYFYLSNEGQVGTPTFEVRPVNEAATVPPGFEAALVRYDRNFPGYDISQGIEIDIQANPVTGLTLFANATYFIQSETKKYNDITLYEGPLGGPDAQPAINNSVGQFFLPYDGRAIIPGTYDWLANVGGIYRPNEKAIFNAIFRYRGITRDPIMKFGIDPEVENIPSSLIIDVSGSYELLSRESYNVKGVLSVNNLFGTNYQTFVHYPMQGRFVSIGLIASIR